MLVDTPGFDGTAADDEFLLEISDWLQAAYQERIRVSGIIYLHRISDARIGRNAIKNLRMLQKFCGTNVVDRVVFTTTFLDHVSMEHGAEREKQLASSEDFLKPMIRRGTSLVRHIGGIESACRCKGDGWVTPRLTRPKDHNIRHRRILPNTTLYA
jgi:hypothetical protein